jgi:hypothetical protein
VLKHWAARAARCGTDALLLSQHVQVQAFLQKLLDADMVYLGEFEGWYDEGQEEYHTETKAAEMDFVSPITGKPLVRAREKNYYFRLSKFQDKLIELYENTPDLVQPPARRNEVRPHPRACSPSFVLGRPWPGGEQQSIATPQAARECQLTHPADTSRSNLADPLGLLSRWRLSGLRRFHVYKHTPRATRAIPTVTPSEAVRLTGGEGGRAAGCAGVESHQGGADGRAREPHQLQVGHPHAGGRGPRHLRVDRRAVQLPHGPGCGRRW